MTCYTEKQLLDLDLVTTEAAAEVIGATYLDQTEDKRPVEVRYTDVVGERQSVTVDA